MKIRIDDIFVSIFLKMLQKFVNKMEKKKKPQIDIQMSITYV